MISVWKISCGHRLFILGLWLLFIGSLNYVLIAPFLKAKLYLWHFVLVVVLGILTYLFWKNAQYLYKIEDNYLYIKTPRSEYKIPLSDIEKVGQIKHIPFQYKIGLKYDFLWKKLYLCGYADDGIILKLKNQDNEIVICPKKHEEFLSALLNKNEASNK